MNGLRRVLWALLLLGLAVVPASAQTTVTAAILKNDGWGPRAYNGWLEHQGDIEIIVQGFRADNDAPTVIVWQANGNDAFSELSPAWWSEETPALLNGHLNYTVAKIPFPIYRFVWRNLTNTEQAFFSQPVTLQDLKGDFVKVFTGPPATILLQCSTRQICEGIQGSVAYSMQFLVGTVEKLRWLANDADGKLEWLSSLLDGPGRRSDAASLRAQLDGVESLRWLREALAEKGDIPGVSKPDIDAPLLKPMRDQLANERDVASAANAHLESERSRINSLIDSAEAAQFNDRAEGNSNLGLLVAFASLMLSVIALRTKKS